MSSSKRIIQERFFKKLAREISNGEYTIETWPSNFCNSINEATRMIPDEKVRKVITYRRAGYTQGEIAGLLLLTKERIRQIEASGINQLSRIDCYSNLHDVSLYGKAKAEEMANERRKNIMEESLLTELTHGRLSVHAYNVLHRGRCKTINDVVNAIKTGRAKHFRGMGQKTYTEIVNMLKDAGFLNSDWSVDI